MEPSEDAEETGTLRRRAREPARTMGVRFTDAEREEIARVAAALDVSAGALIRAGALQAARAGPALLAQEAVAVHRAAGELAAIGRALTRVGRALEDAKDGAAVDLALTVEALRDRVIQLDAAHRALLSAHVRRGEAARRTLGAGPEADIG